MKEAKESEPTFSDIGSLLIMLGVSSTQTRLVMITKLLKPEFTTPPKDVMVKTVCSESILPPDLSVTKITNIKVELLNPPNYGFPNTSIVNLLSPIHPSKNSLT